MIKKPIFLPESQLEDLKLISQEDGRPIPEHIREAISRYILIKKQIKQRGLDNDSL